MQIRLTVDVTYSLNDEYAATMAALLPRMCEQAIGDGMLTGGSAATVESHYANFERRLPEQVRLLAEQQDT